LKNVKVRRGQNIGGLKIYFNIVVGNVLDSSDNPILELRAGDFCLDWFPISLKPLLHLAGDHKPHLRQDRDQPSQGGHQEFQTLVRGDLTEEEYYFFHRRNAQLHSRSWLIEIRLTICVIDPERDDTHPLRYDSEIHQKLPLHRCRMDEDMAAEAVLNSEREPIEPTVVTTSLSGIYVVRGKDHSLPEETVIDHERGAVEVLEFIIPEQMKDLGLRARNITGEPGIIGQNADDLAQHWSILVLIAAQI